MNFLLIVVLGLAQQTLAQFEPIDEIRVALEELNEGSGEDDEIIRKGRIVDTPSSRCGSQRYGPRCLYPQLPYTPATPEEQWPENGKTRSGKNVCSVFGGTNVISFDGSLARYEGGCMALVAKLCEIKDAPALWVRRSKECNGCIQEVMVEYDGKTVTFEDDLVKHDGKSWKIEDGFSVARDDLKPLKVWKEDSYVVLELGEITAQFSREENLLILVLPDSYASRVCGVCGNMNGDQTDDVTVEGTPNYLQSYDRSCKDLKQPPENPDMERCMELDSTRRMCNMLISEPFSDCLTFLRPSPYYLICMVDICSGDVMVDDKLLCPIATQYSKLCAVSGGHADEWRSLANCVKECPTGMTWSECKLSRSCESLNTDQLEMTVCTPGCECLGKNYFQDGACVPKSECRCFKDGKFFGPGEQYQSACNNTCTCHEGRWTCTDNQCPGVAVASGLFRYTTFDGLTFQHKDTCVFVFAQDCKNKAFSIMVGHEEVKGTFYKYVIVVMVEDGHKHFIKLRRDGQIEHNNELQNAPYVSGLMRIRHRTDTIVMELLREKVTITYDMVASVVVHVPRTYMDKMCGLAGNYNGEQKDDMMLKSGYVANDLAKFAKHWLWVPSCNGKVEDSGTPSECPEFEEALDICKSLEPYKGKCLFPPKKIQGCQADVCESATSEQRAEIACSDVRSSLLACEKRTGKTLEPLSVEACYTPCPETLVERKSTKCLQSCASFANACDNDTYTSCFCPEGTYSTNVEGECVEQSECPCLFDGVWYNKGKITDIPNMTCTCDAGTMECVSEPISACPSPDMIYYTCEDPANIQGAACAPTCETMNDICAAGACQTGCACKPGLYRTKDDECVPKEECGCVAPDRYYKHGESYKDDCNTVTCVGGTFKSTDLVCPKTCWAVGASHYQSFDGRTFDFDGDCEYILATDYCSNNPEGGLFSVHTSNTKCGSTGITCSKSIIITVKNQKITIERGREPRIELIAGTRFARSAAVTGYTDHSKPETFTIKQKGLFTVIDTCIGLTVLWDNGTRIYVRLTEAFQGKTCGMCGNFDGRDNNDWVMSNGDSGDNVVEFANSWKYPPSTSKCPDATLATQVNNSCVDSTRREWAEEKCQVIKDKNGPFAACHSKVMADPYYDACVQDACGCDGGGDCECLCTAIAHYAHQCGQKQSPVEWRSNSLCPIMCDQYNDDEDVCLWHYRSCDTCITDTCCECQTPEDTHWCVEGCFPKCPSGYILDEMTQKCVRESERNEKCTPYSLLHMCHTCENCNECRTKDGARLRVNPGEEKYFPVATDACEREWCASFTTGDLCYNSTVKYYDCNVEYEAIPKYDDRFYTQICVNSTTSKCKNCRDCHQECIYRNDSCIDGKNAGDKWRKSFEISPVPKRGAKTYCLEYTCQNHTLATEPQCKIQVAERVTCVQSIDDVICEDFEVLKVYPTGDECCPETYNCTCELCTLQLPNGELKRMKELSPDETDEWCVGEETSNCCYTDTCTAEAGWPANGKCPVVTRTQAPCTTGPAPTCAPGYVWKNMTREADCCPWGECVCDSCSDYDAFNTRVLKALDSVWNKKCLKFRCLPETRGTDGCYESRNYENVTCLAKPECSKEEYVKIVGRDEWDCCDIYDCVCYDSCIVVTSSGTERRYEIGTEYQGEDGCWYKCVDPRTSEDDENCPGPQKICHPPKDCAECQIIAEKVNDTCGCLKYECETIERCPVIDCPFPYVRVVDPVADKCKEPCYDCECQECWDQHQNRTYQVGKKWRRTFIEPEVKCENCVCTDSYDDDGCLKESCEPIVCPPVDTCESPYDNAILGKDGCGCTILLGCTCPHCMLDGKVLAGRKAGQTWTKGNVDLGCYDTYTCLTVKSLGASAECFNVTKKRTACMVDDECPEDFVAIKDELRSCCFDDGECCPRHNCTCVKCRFDGKSYDPGDKWTKDCINYECTDEVDPGDPAKCKKISSSVVDCPANNATCTDCYVQYLETKREVPDHCCDIWGCQATLYCEDKDGKLWKNGSIWEPTDVDCKRYMCYVSQEDWNLTPKKCPAIIEIDHCDPDNTVCKECYNRTIVKDECGCDKVECPRDRGAVSCTKAAKNQIIDLVETNNVCAPSKNCCICDDACYYKGARKELFSIWRDEETCKRMRCALPDATLTALGFDPEEVYFDDESDSTTISQIASKLSYRKLLRESNIARAIYDECSQDISLCPKEIELDCPKPKECGPCEVTTDGVDKCGCPTISCSPCPCPPAPYDVTECTEPKAVLVNVSLEAIPGMCPCCKVGRQCVCRKGCLDSEGTLRDIGETWDETGTNECGKTLTKKKCVAATDVEEATSECPQTIEIPCAEPAVCADCFNKTSYIDDYCCEIVQCKPLDRPVECLEPGKNQRVSTLETEDECFPSKQCCVCDNTCAYNNMTLQLFQVYKDVKACSRMRCVLPEATIRKLGYSGDIDFKDLTNAEMEAKWQELKGSVDYRTMMLDSRVSQSLYEECQQDIGLCPKLYDMGCEPAKKCGECEETIIKQDACGCDIATCETIIRCPIPKCTLPYRLSEIPDSDPCKAPCYNCTCDHTCLDNFDDSTHEPGTFWNRTYRNEKCERCTCTNTKDEEDGCLKESCELIPCPAVDVCPEPYDKAVHGYNICGCKILLECECTRCMLDGKIVDGRKPAQSWTVGDVEKGCYDTYFCDPKRDPEKRLECYNVTIKRTPCIEDPECPENHVPVKNEERSCCFDDDECCPRFDCECVVCNFDDKAYKPGETWQKDCIDYTCTNVTDQLDPKKCKKIESDRTPCNTTKPACPDKCYELYLKTPISIPDQCCEVWDCKARKVCILEDGTEKDFGDEWFEGECKKLRCSITDEDWAAGKCPAPVVIDHCDPAALDEECPRCTNRTIVKDKCDCDSVTCPKNNDPVHCTEPKKYQVLTTLETGDECFPSKNCCVCDNACYYKGARKELFSVWKDPKTCTRMRCVPPANILKEIGYEESELDYKDLETSIWAEIRDKLSYRAIMIKSKIASKLYDECSQEASFCPESREIGCKDPEVCEECYDTINSTDACGCKVVTCKPYVCPPAPYDVEECPPPKTNLVEISLKGKSDRYPCCPVGRECVCHEVCFDHENKTREVGEEWDQPSTYVCSEDPTVSGSIVRKRCAPGKVVDVEVKREKRSEDDFDVCPHSVDVQCDDPPKCAECEIEKRTLTNRCCANVTCTKIECEINVPTDCVAPKTVLKSDAEVTGSSCCPKYCDCPSTCLEEANGKKYDINLKWPHPRSECWTRSCLVDRSGAKNGGCPYIVNNTVCTDPEECEDCFTAVDTIDGCGCTKRFCRRNPCPSLNCSECEEVYETDTDTCGCPVLACRKKPCPAKLITCDNDEMSVYSWLDLKVDKCCPQRECRCNFTKCTIPECPLGQIAVRNVSAVKCCCAEYMCIPSDDTGCKDYNGIPRKVGVPWENKDNHCKMLQCTYDNVKKRTYKIEEFDRFFCSEEKPICVNGGTPYLASTKTGCCREWVCPCTCQVYGDPHFTTFDGFSYDYQGKCTYTLMKENKFNETEVIVDNELCRWQSARRKSLSCLKTMTVMHKKVNYTFTFGHKFLLNGEMINVRRPWVNEEEGITVREFGYKQLKIEIAPIGMSIIYKTREWMQSLILTIPYESLEGRMSGLCGTCNNDPSDEFITRSGKKMTITDDEDHAQIDAFGEGWMKGIKDYDQPKCFPKEPECPDSGEFPDCGELPPTECIDCSNRCHLSHEKCHPCEEDPCKVLKSHPVFKEANEHIDPNTYMAKCAYDLSQENNVSNKCDACFSPSVGQYASLNEFHGLCIPWRKALKCSDTKCPATQEYRECDLDAKRDLSCDNQILNITGSVRVEGCFCPEGSIRRSGSSEECVPVKCCAGCSEPPTCDDGTAAVAGDSTDDCGCPVYMCTGASGCQMKSIPKTLTIDLDGTSCSSTKSVPLNECSGNCAVSTRQVNDELDVACGKCLAMMDVKTVAFMCEDGVEREQTVDVITGCKCKSFPCE